MQPWSVLFLGDPAVIAPELPSVLGAAGARIQVTRGLLEMLQLGRSIIPDVVVIDLKQAGAGGFTADRKSVV